jgi:hypothetical protein
VGRVGANSEELEVEELEEFLVPFRVRGFELAGLVIGRIGSLSIDFDHGGTNHIAYDE